MSPAEAAARLARSFGLSPALEERLAIMLEHPEGVRSPANEPARKLNQVHICNLRPKLWAKARVEILSRADARQIPEHEEDPLARQLSGLKRTKPKADNYYLALGERRRLMDMARDLAEPAPPHPSTVSPPGLRFSPIQAVVHHALVAAGSAWLTRPAIASAMADAKIDAALGHALSVHIHRLRKKGAPAGLQVETFYGVGWRYSPDSLADFQAASLPGALAPHLSPIKKGGPAR